MHFADSERHSVEDARPIAAPVTSRLHTTPRLMVPDAPLPHTTPRATVANLALPAARVQARAAALVDEARQTGRGHSLRLWRLALQTALQDMAREASGLPATATCRTFTWEARGEAYHVLATFAPRTTIH
jgi:hypothetical protein